MTSRMRGALALVSLLVGGSVIAEAQSGPAHFGPKLMYNFDSKDFGIGLHLTKPLTDAISLYPSLDYWFTNEGVTTFGANIDFTYEVQSANLQWLYLGAGLGIVRTSIDDPDFSDTSVGLNLIGGFQPAAGRIKPFAEARLWVGDGSSFSVVGGLRIPLGN